MQLRCGFCKIEFTPGPNHLRMWSRDCCPRCYAPRFRISMWGFGVALIVLLIALLAIAAKRLGGRLSHVLFWPLASLLPVIYASFWIQILATLVIAVVLRLRIFSINLGDHGSTLCQLRVRRTNIILRSGMFGGTVLFYPASRAFVRTRMCVTYATAFLIQAGSIGLGVALFRRDDPLAPTSLFMITIIVVNSLILAIELLPLTIHATPPVQSRSRIIWDYIGLSDQEIASREQYYFYLEGLDSQQQGELDVAEHWFQQGTDRHPDHFTCWYGLHNLYIRQVRYHEFRTVLLRLLNLTQDPLTAALMENNLAWTNVMLGSPNLVEEATEKSRRTLDRCPDNLNYQTVRGLVLVAMGDAEAGLLLIEKAAAASTTPADQAGAECNMALARLKLGDLPAAQLSLSRARAIDPAYFVIMHVEAAMERQYGRGSTST